MNQNKKTKFSPVVEDLKTADYVIEKIEKKERKTSSYPPFTTSTLQQAAANRLGMTSKQTMSIAQQLYEEGLITYHRTDSFNLAPKAITMARDYIGQVFGQDIYRQRRAFLRPRAKMRRKRMKPFG